MEAPCEPPCANGPQKAPPSRCASTSLALSSTRKASNRPPVASLCIVIVLLTLLNGVALVVRRSNSNDGAVWLVLMSKAGTENESADPDEYESVACLACQRVHLVNPASSKVMGKEDE